MIYDSYMAWWFQEKDVSLQELAYEPGRPENIVNDRNIKTMWVILQEYKRTKCGKIAVSISISKVSIFYIQHKNVQHCHVCSIRVPHHLTEKINENRNSPTLWAETHASKWSKFYKVCNNISWKFSAPVLSPYEDRNTWRLICRLIK